MLRDDLPRQFINIEGAINLRDFGGYQTQDGREVKKGLLFRCGLMSEIAEHAFEDFAALDIGVICDLRSHEEADANPTPDVAPFDVRVHIPIWPGSSNQFQQTISEVQKRPTAEDFANFMNKVTREIARDHVHAYKELMSHLRDTDRGFLLHCSAGKDRTGFGAAIILTMLGVDHDTVLHDYLVSNEATELAERARERMMSHMREQGLPEKIDDNVLHIMSGVKADYLLAAFEEIDNHYGGIHGYLEEVGITAAEQRELERKLLAG
ncbi:MAG: tyrosine-protein phosphatase [Pseudomonadales bacterium]|jgi:protein-tyrosine phosphatase|nr:tyrosine-protein phosphatase [Pseudomonadales bacterium]